MRQRLELKIHQGKWMLNYREVRAKQKENVDFMYYICTEQRLKGFSEI